MTIYFIGWFAAIAKLDWRRKVCWVGWCTILFCGSAAGRRGALNLGATHAGNEHVGVLQVRPVA